jgi:hypothetical protein
VGGGDGGPVSVEEISREGGGSSIEEISEAGGWVSIEEISGEGGAEPFEEISGSSARVISVEEISGELVIRDCYEGSAMGRGEESSSSPRMTMEAQMVDEEAPSDL